MEVFTGKRAHVAEFGIYVCPGYRNLGLGTRMLEEFIQIAKENHYEVLQLSVFSTNKRAMMSTGNAVSNDAEN